MEALISTPAPSAVVDPTGRPAFGTYRGAVPKVSWAGLQGPFARGGLWQRLHHKRWQYLGIVHRDVMLAGAIIDAGIAASAFLYVFDRRERHLVSDRSWTTLPGRAVVSDAPFGGLSRYAAGPAKLEIAGKNVSFVAEDVMVEAELDLERGTDPLCAIAPLADGVGNCTHKMLGIPTIGRVSVGSKSWDLGGALASIDHTNGLLARNTQWRWASGTDGRVSFNLVEGFNGPCENVVWRDGALHHVGPVTFSYEAAKTTGPWTIRSADKRLHLVFTPEGERRQDKNLLVAKSWYVQPFGTFSGAFDGVGINDVLGVTEDHIAVW